MYSFTNTIFLLSTLAFISAADDFTWRDFDGEIPYDALQAGHDSHGTIYIGQILFESKVIPGKLYKNNGNIYFSVDQKSYKATPVTHNIKVFCTKHPENFHWLTTKHTEYINIIKYHKLVIGGFQEGYKTYIGRVFENREFDVGKVLCRPNYCLALYTSKDGKSKKYYEYSVLVEKSNNIYLYTI